MYFADSSKVVCEPSDDYAGIVKYTRAGLFNRCLINKDLLESPDFNHQEWEISSKSGFYSLEATECGSDLTASNVDPLNEYISWRGGVKKDDVSDIVLILTDDFWADTYDSALNNSRSLKEDGVRIICIGTPRADLEFLKKISTSDSYAGLFDFSELGTAFSSIGRSISSGSGISI